MFPNSMVSSNARGTTCFMVLSISCWVYGMGYPSALAIFRLSYIMSSEISALRGVVKSSQFCFPHTAGTMPQWSRWLWVRNMWSIFPGTGRGYSGGLVGLTPYSISMVFPSPSMVIAMRPTMSAPPKKLNFIFIGLTLLFLPLSRACDRSRMTSGL